MASLKERLHNLLFKEVLVKYKVNTDIQGVFNNLLKMWRKINIGFKELYKYALLFIHYHC